MTKIDTTGLTMDPTTVNAIKENGNTVEGLTQAADQFETMFLQMVLKSMRTANDALASDDSLVNSDRQRMYRDMYDGQLTMAMTDKSSIGIADAMVRQMSPLVTHSAIDVSDNNLDVTLKFAEKEVAISNNEANGNQNEINSNQNKAHSNQDTVLGSFSQSLLNIFTAD